MKLKKPADKSKSKAAVKATSEKLSKFYQDIANGEATILPDLDIDELIETKLSNYDRNLLHLAVWYRQNEIVNQICRKEELKCLINEQDNNGDTPLHLAVFTMNVEAYRTLLLAGGDTTILNNRNELPLEAIQDTKECEDLSQRLTSWTPTMLPDIKLTLIPDHSNILIPSPMNSTKRDSWRSTAHSPLAMDSQTRPLVVKNSLNEPKSKFGSNNSETTGILSRSVSIAEDLVDSDRENPKDMLDVVRSKIFKDPKTLSQVHECSIKDHSQSISYCKSSPKQRSNKKYGSSLLTKITSQTFYFINKTPSKSIPESDDWPKKEDLGF